ncbi:MAG: hypothetical protein ACXWEW_01305 [Nitrososphaeraceae archaeon]
MTITIIDYNRSITQLSILYIHAEPNDNNKGKGGDDQEKEKKITKEEQDQTKDKDNDKDNDNGNKNDNSDSSYIDPAYRSFFPIKRIVIPDVYETIPNGQTYRFNINNPNDKVQVDKTDKENIFTHQNLDGSWRIDYGKPRIDIHTKDAGILPDKVDQLNNLSKGKIQSWNYSELKDIGYWYKPTDWKNIEVTLVFKLLDSARSKGDQHALSIVTRSISHSQLDSEYKKSDDEPQFFCGGSSYHNNLSNDGSVRMKKEQFHIDYEWERYNPDITVGNIYNKIIGFKAIVYNVNDTAVTLESWVDTENQGKGPYKKIHEGIDLGNWGDNMKACGAETDGQAITWGSPIVILKANDFKFDIYDIEVREIIPPLKQISQFS